MTVKTLDISQATESLADYARHGQHETTIITESGEPLAMLVYLDNVDAETLSLSQNPEFLAIIERSRERHQKEGGVSLDEMRRRYGHLAKSES